MVRSRHALHEHSQWLHNQYCPSLGDPTERYVGLIEHEVHPEPLAPILAPQLQTIIPVGILPR
ncbi:MAG: hypothetical protein PF483_02045 [Halothiobacillus sp.]|nr:hypothetical protein [Halothiobacillus sp.]